MEAVSPATPGEDLLLRTWRELDVPDGWRAEIIDPGRISLVAPPSNPHNFIAGRANRALLRTIPDDWDIYQTLGMWITPLCKLFIPDLVVAPHAVLRDTKAPVPAEEIFLAVEITSKDNADTDRKTKLWGYAHGPVPLYLLIDAWDPNGPSVTLYENPRSGRYLHSHTVPFGEKITVPAPFDLELDTSEFPPGEEWD
ncbi:Uma2 family endonuclease [Spinactinospora alkalitolerans]